jgi:hypothetical protein
MPFGTHALAFGSSPQTRMSDEITERFGDEQARSILARAIELDAHGPLTTVDQLRHIAAELGVSPAALDRALHEQRTGRRDPPHASHLPAARRIAALGVPLGLVGGSVIASGSTLAVVSIMGVGLVLSGCLAIYESKGASLRSFHLKNAILWGGALVGSAASAMLLSQGTERASLLVAAAWCVRTWISSGILGSATIVAVRRSRRHEGDDNHSQETPATAESRRPGVLPRLLDTIKKWLHSRVGIQAPAA